MERLRVRLHSKRTSLNNVLSASSEIKCVVLKIHTGGWNEKPAVIEKGETSYCLNMRITAHIFKQSVLEDIPGISLSCSHEK